MKILKGWDVVDKWGLVDEHRCIVLRLVSSPGWSWSSMRRPSHWELHGFRKCCCPEFAVAYFIAIRSRTELVFPPTVSYNITSDSSYCRIGRISFQIVTDFEADNIVDPLGDNENKMINGVGRVQFFFDYCRYIATYLAIFGFFINLEPLSSYQDWQDKLFRFIK